MDPFDAFAQTLHDTLAYLYDPTYRPSDLICRVLGIPSGCHMDVVRPLIIEAIAELSPAYDLPPTARLRRLYDLLSCRYVRELTQRETALLLGITPRHLRREQQQAVRLLAERLWERANQTSPIPLPSSSILSASDNAWRDQIRQELRSLQHTAPRSITSVAAVIDEVLDLAAALTAGCELTLQARAISSDLIVKLHPSVLRQLLLTAVEALIQVIPAGSVSLDAVPLGEHLRVILVGGPCIACSVPVEDFIKEILDVVRGTLSVSWHNNEVTICIDLPATSRVAILVIDDNADLVHFYRRFVEGTRYAITHVSQGCAVFDAIAASSPHLIVLDVMLPDVDGWKLLIDLRHHPLSRDIPIVVCSVVRHEKLALALGAAQAITKPVTQEQFLGTLDRVLG